MPSSCIIHRRSILMRERRVYFTRALGIGFKVNWRRMVWFKRESPILLLMQTTLF